ncbi:MAG: hypothetical protein ACP5QX_06060 [Caldisericaceae bacterium]
MEKIRRGFGKDWGKTKRLCGSLKMSLAKDFSLKEAHSILSLGFPALSCQTAPRFLLRTRLGCGNGSESSYLKYK